MTTVKVIKEKERIKSIECDGHTGYGVEGEDIVCAAISSIVQTAVLGVLSVAGVNADYKIDEKRGWLKLTIPDRITPEQAHDVDVILKTLMLGVADLHESFSDFVELEVK
ncbi:MAG: ribosomal-processing cysteine protease Prp [Clostridia bacterium]|nr:ribosomal-processing cysteine protease Prp [Clostridia bacterium]